MGVDSVQVRFLCNLLYLQMWVLLIPLCNSQNYKKDTTESFEVEDSRRLSFIIFIHLKLSVLGEQSVALQILKKCPFYALQITRPLAGGPCNSCNMDTIYTILRVICPFWAKFSYFAFFEILRFCLRFCYLGNKILPFGKNQQVLPFCRNILGLSGKFTDKFA